METGEKKNRREDSDEE
ncbi:Protein CBG27080 [Caenorhabditis briggsae]|uniref:Protein CBG27080 n=1 Tax=Caenorhabditis briggsae TaxID=6238 RepID=B6IHF6_CAEBR|nr:Protein CBG27080 [Caenorhabditis briggsae]CAR99336.1 Protein CBG27080 [Caenorhabditis briggsae]